MTEGLEPLLMTRDGLGVWSFTSDPLDPDLYLYSFVVDGETTHDPANEAGVRTGEGGRQSLVHVQAPYALPWESSGACPLTDQLAVSRELGAGLIEGVLPLIEREYRVRPDRESRAIAGLSMGGSQALHIGLNHRELFAHVAAFGGALIMYGGRYGEWFLRRSVAGPNVPQSLYSSVGSGDFFCLG